MSQNKETTIVLKFEPKQFTETVPDCKDFDIGEYYVTITYAPVTRTEVWHCKNRLICKNYAWCDKKRQTIDNFFKPIDKD